MIAGLILAAGEATRMGRLKQLLPWGDSILLAGAVAAYQQAAVCPLYVVVGCQAAAVMERLGPADIRWVVNPDYRQGMGSSLAAGIKALPAAARAVLLGLGDLPAVEPQTLRAVMDCYRENPADIVVPVYQGQPGHPVLLGREFFPALQALTGDAGAKSIIRAHGKQTVYLEVGDPGICRDIDDPPAYHQFKPKKGGGRDAHLD